jgi:predicted amidophosphoribosyltransferase
MPSVGELTALYSNFMLGPRPGPGVCDVCFDLTGGRGRCHRCANGRRHLAAVCPISYSIAGEQLHHVLVAYKRQPPSLARRFRVELAAVLWRFLDGHEACIAQAATTPGFDLVTTVPSGRTPSLNHPLEQIVGELVTATRDRHRQLLERSAEPVEPRVFNPRKFTPRADLKGRSVLLIDDVWTTGASKRSAAAALREAVAGVVAGLIIGRHLHRDYGDNDRRLRELPSPFDWATCAHE